MASIQIAPLYVCVMAEPLPGCYAACLCCSHHRVFVCCFE